MSDTTEKRVAIYVPSDLHREAKAKAARLGTSFQQVLLPYFESWTRGTETVAPAPVAKPTGKNAEWIERLELLFNTPAKKDQATTIRELLRSFTSDLAKDQAGKKKVG